MRHDGPHRSRGGALHVRPDGKMGHWSNPLTWQIDGRYKPRLKAMMKRHATRKLRQRDHRLDEAA